MLGMASLQGCYDFIFDDLKAEIYFKSGFFKGGLILQSTVLM